MTQTVSAAAATMASLGDPAELDENIGIVHLVSGRTSGGEAFYAYISVKPSLYERFFYSMAVAGEPINLLSYGEILRAGYGREPDAVVRAEMEQKHGIDHHLIQKALA